MKINPIKELVLLILSAYRSTKKWRPRCCRFYPSCSAYAKIAVQSHGLMLGAILTTVRLIKCQPFHPGGIDEVPVKIKFLEQKLPWPNCELTKQESPSPKALLLQRSE